jgi:hypothetical protein
MRTTRIFVAGTVLLVLGLALFSLGSAAAQGTQIRWDLASITVDTATISEGGAAYALSQDSSVIRLTGFGTFDPADPTSATGGGEWMTFDPAGNPVGSGAYTVTGLVSYVEAPGSLPAEVFTDTIAPIEDVRAGLATLTIAYEDADGNEAGTGVLILSCQLLESPLTIFEGIVATQDAVTYWNHAPALPLTDINYTIFHVVA